jgi:hypothetical protein
MIRPWNEIREFYESYSPLGIMLALVSEIEKSRYSTGLHAWTSMQDLCIAQMPVEYPYNGPYLRISPLSEDRCEFRYVDTPSKEKQWSRIATRAESFARLESFFGQLHWFS